MNSLGTKRQYHEFWNRLNEEYDDRSIPKRIGKQLLELHLKRGDDIYIISRRQGTVPPTNTVKHRLERMFGIVCSIRWCKLISGTRLRSSLRAISFTITEIRTAISRQLSARRPCLSGCGVLRLPMPRTSRTTANSTKSCWKTPAISKREILHARRPKKRGAKVQGILRKVTLLGGWQLGLESEFALTQMRRTDREPHFCCK